MLLAWMREAAQAGRALRLDNLPGGLTTIAQLYGVDELLPAAQTKH
jgi:ABC-type transporter Mla MlaB component